MDPGLLEGDVREAALAEHALGAHERDAASLRLRILFEQFA